MTQTLTELKAALVAAEDAKYSREISDDFCYVNGSIEPILIEIARLQIAICKHLLPSIKAGDDAATHDAARAFLADLLPDVNGIAWITQQNAEKVKK